MTEYYVSGCIDNGSEVETCDDSEATFWTLYERDDDGLSQGIIDCTFREDAEAAMRVYQERDDLQQQVNALAAENLALKEASSLLVSKYIANKGRDSEFIAVWTPAKSSIGTGDVWDMWRDLDSASSKTPATEAITRQWMKIGAGRVARRASELYRDSPIGGEDRHLYKNLNRLARQVATQLRQPEEKAE